MDINLVKYFLEHRRPEIARKSLKNCHCKGVDSIVFDDTPGRVTRMFVTNENHELWEKKKVAIHPHHCDLRFECIKGTFYNITADFDKDYINNELNEFIYQSKILTNKAGFIHTGKKFTFTEGTTPVYKGQKFLMSAKELHTVEVDAGDIVAWVVYEGKEDPNYQPICYSNADLENFDASKLYQPMTHEYLYKTLRRVWPEL